MFDVALREPLRGFIFLWPSCGLVVDVLVLAYVFPGERGIDVVIVA